MVTGRSLCQQKCREAGRSRESGCRASRPGGEGKADCEEGSSSAQNKEKEDGCRRGFGAEGKAGRC